MGSFAESVELIHRLWTEDDVVFNGKYHSVDKPIVEPAPQADQLWIGGGGERVTLRLVAQYGDACNFGTGSVDVIQHKLAILRQHCDEVGRDYDEIVKSTSLNVFPIDKGDDPQRATEKALGPMNREKFDNDNLIGTEDEIAAKVDASLEAGADYIIFYVPGVAYDLDLVDRVEQVAKRFA